MNAEEVLHRLHSLVGELMILETEAERMGKSGVWAHLEAARANVVSAVREMEPPLERGQMEAERKGGQDVQG